MRIFAIINQKGGSGKTTTAFNLAAAFAEMNKHVLVLDLDPQASASLWYGYKNQGRALYEVFVANRPFFSAIERTKDPFIDVVCSSPLLAGVERDLAKEIGKEIILRQKISVLDKKNWDFLFIDCPPNLGLLSINALVCASDVLIPVETHVLALHGIVQLMQTIRAVKKRLNPSLKLAGILPCRVHMHMNHAREIIEQLHKYFPRDVCRTMIRENIKIAEAPLHHVSIFQYDKKASAALDYKALAEELITEKKDVVTYE